MNFQAVFSYLKRGHRAALPEWGGYWTWCEEAKTIVMHTRDGGVVDIRDSEDRDYTLSFMFRDDWELLDPEEVTEHDEAWEETLAEVEEEEGLGVTEEEEAALAFLENLLDQLAEDDEEELEEEECGCLVCTFDRLLEAVADSDDEEEEQTVYVRII